MNKSFESKLFSILGGGADGKSAYDIWIEEGNTGTKEDFLASLKGPKGDKGATGATGKTGPQGPIGPAGKDGAQGPQGIQGIQGPKGDRGATGPKGDSGEQGPQGIQGPKGATGAKGADGTTPTIGTNGNWYLGTQDTGKPSRGEQGERGEKGRTGPAGRKGDKGDQGDPGPIGLTGERGPQGPAGPSKIADNLTTTDPSYALSANQGKKIYDLLEQRTNGKVKIKEDGEGGQIDIESKNGLSFSIDILDDIFRFYTFGKDGTYRSHYINAHEDGGKIIGELDFNPVKAFTNDSAKNNVITDALMINTVGDFSPSYMKPGIIATEDGSSIKSCPVAGPFYAYREVLFVSHQGRSGGKTIVKLIEAYPIPGRIWVSAYNPDFGNWTRWRTAALNELKTGKGAHNTNYSPDAAVNWTRSGNVVTMIMQGTFNFSKMSTANQFNMIAINLPKPSAHSLCTFQPMTQNSGGVVIWVNTNGEVVVNRSANQQFGNTNFYAYIYCSYITTDPI